MEKQSKKFTVYLKNGKPIDVTWYPDYFQHTDHLELRGCMTSTGYRSDFLNKDRGTELNPNDVMEHARQLAQKCWEENENKYGVQSGLFQKQ